MKRFFKYSFVFMMSILFCMKVSALSGTVTDTSVRIRSNAGTSYVTLAEDAGYGNKYNLIDNNLYPTNDGSTGCGTGKWYKISYNNQTGYICSEFFRVDSNSSEQDNSTVSSISLSDNKGIVACYEDSTSLPMRSSVGGSTVANLNCGDQVEILDTDTSVTDKCYSWYKVKFGSTTGYVCGKYITTNYLSKVAREYYNSHSLTDYNNSLKALGFPDSYLPYLDELHARYPNWKFEVLNTGLDYSLVTSLESAVGTSLIQGDPAGYKSTAGGSYNYYTDTFSALDGSSWYAANHAVVSYYMDPRLYLKPNYVFMFEKLTYDSRYHTVDKVSNLLSSTKLGTYDSNYASYYMEAANLYNVSPIHLASRTRQEVGSSTAVISGAGFDYNGKHYSGLYNTYNIGAYSGADNWKKGLIYANGGENGSNTSYGRPWNTLKKAIIGGGEFISSGYINNNQYTDYLQKFNVINGQSKIGVHQYMTNLRAPLGEASSTYNTYNSFGMLSNEFVFSIPVYNNMQNMYVLPNPGNPNNYLSSLKVNDSTVTGFDGGVTSYDVYVSSSTSSIKLYASTVNSGSKISGNITGTGAASGNISINEGKNTVTVKVTAGNGSLKTYTVNVYREKATEPTTPTPDVPATTGELSNVITSVGYRISNNYLKGISPGSKASYVINSIKQKDANVNVVVKNSSGKVIEDDFIGTGSTVELSKGDYKLNVTVVIYGDPSGDGKINALDLLKVQKHILEVNKLNGSNLEAADPSRDGKVNALDLLKVQKNILGLSSINQ